MFILTAGLVGSIVVASVPLLPAWVVFVTQHAVAYLWWRPLLMPPPASPMSRLVVGGTDLILA